MIHKMEYLHGYQNILKAHHQGGIAEAIEDYAKDEGFLQRRLAPLPAHGMKKTDRIRLGFNGTDR